MKGVVKYFDPLKGYGFIRPYGKREDHFVHRTDLTEGVSLDVGDKVEFKSVRGEKGWKAVDVKKLG